MRKKWWVELRKNLEEYSKVIKRIGDSSKGRIMPKGDKSNGWKGGRFKLNGYVYIYCPSHPRSVKGGKGGGGYVLEHRLVIEKSIGRYLTKEEDVHHINGIKDDNRLENLKLVSHYNHFGEMICPHCGKKVYTK